MNSELAWALGLFEGEGCISVLDHKTRGYVYPRAQLQLATTDEDVLRRFAAAVKLGRINGPYSRGRKPVWVWTAAKQAEVRQLLTAWLPALGARRAAKAREALDHMPQNEHDPPKRAVLGEKHA